MNETGYTVPTPRWSFNGDVNSPTFRPSVRHYIQHPNTGQEQTVCHYHVTAGKIEYCSDFEHAFKGQTIDMADIPTDCGF